MSQEIRKLSDLSVSDITAQRLWRYTPAPVADGEIYVRADRAIHITTLKNKIVGGMISLASGRSVASLFENIFLDDEFLSAHWMLLRVVTERGQFNLARYHDYNYDESGPLQLASFLNLSISEVFPIKFDLRSLLGCDSPALAGVIEKAPAIKCTRAELIGRMVPR